MDNKTGCAYNGGRTCHVDRLSIPMMALSSTIPATDAICAAKLRRYVYMLAISAKYRHLTHGGDIGFLSVTATKQKR